MGFEDRGSEDARSHEAFKAWREGHCQPNFRKYVFPNPRRSCGPYSPGYLPREGPVAEGASASLAEAPPPADGEAEAEAEATPAPRFHPRSHDTIALGVIDARGRIAVGASTNGANHKVPGRVGDGAIPGASVYAEAGVGACGASGDGDRFLRFSLCFGAVQSMRRGADPGQAARAALARVAHHYPDLLGGLWCLDAESGAHGGAAYGWVFTYTIRSPETEGASQVITVQPMTAEEVARLQAEDRASRRPPARPLQILPDGSESGPSRLTSSSAAAGPAAGSEDVDAGIVSVHAKGQTNRGKHMVQETIAELAIDSEVGPGHAYV